MMEKMKIVVTENGIHPCEGLFSGPVLNSNTYKIYIIVHQHIIHYVGKTKQCIGDKFRQGFGVYKKVKNGGEKPSGYSGYKWISEHLNSKQEIDLIVFDLHTEENRFAEAVEAEIVFLVRKETDRWPECQNEIHFHNIEEAKKVADEVFHNSIK